MFEMYDQIDEQAVIKVIGVGGGGGNALEHMLNSGIEGVEFINANTDAQVLTRSKADIKIQMGVEQTKGLGAGADPNVGRQAAMDDRDKITEVLKDTDMVFITAGMGGGTGTGAAPVIAQIAKDMGILTVAVVTKPFPFEGRKRSMLAEQGISELSQHVDSLITIPNEKILTVLGKQAKFTDAFAKANDVLYNAVQGISELITQPGFINVDFADVKTVMSEMGIAMMGSSVSKGPERAKEATRGAISSPFLEDVNMQGAKGILVNITASMDMEVGEYQEVGEIIEEFTSEDATVIMGTAFDESMEDELRVTIVVTGLDNPGKSKATDRKSFRNVNKTGVMRKSPPVLDDEVSKDDDRREFVKNSQDEKPARRVSRAEFVGSAAVAKQIDDWDELDVPAFLRNQAD